MPKAAVPIDPIIKFLPYQKAWMEDQSRYKVGMMTRRGGKTFGTMGEVAADCTQAEIERRITKWTILSRSEDTASEAIKGALEPMIRAYYAVLGGLARKAKPEFSEGVFIDPAHEQTITAGDKTATIEVPEARYKTFEVNFPGGSRVKALSASPNAARGFGGNLILDEFAFHKNPRAIWAAAFPVAARGGHKIRVISTPNGKGNKFYDLMTANDAVWSRHECDIYEAVRQGLDVDIDEIRAGLSDEDIWAQEFELKWLDEGTAWLDYDLISANEHPAAGLPALYQGGPCFSGEDIAARNDLFVLPVFEAVGDVLWLREMVVRKRISFAEQDAIRAEMFQKYRIVRHRMDQTGMGEKPVEDAKRHHGEDRVEGVLFTTPNRLDLATRLKEAMQDRKARIPAGDVVLRADLHSIQSSVGPTGARRLVADGETDGHADRFWAMALAVSGSTSTYQAYDYRAVPRHGGDDFDRDMRITGGFAAGKGIW